MVNINAQEYINKKYPTKEKKAEIKKLEIKSKNLEGELDLREFTNLEYLDCTDNKLTDIKFSNNKKIKYLLIKSNNFEKKNLSFLKEFTNLITLDISNNFFFGSLSSLNSMEKLQLLDISDTDIDEGAKYLSDSVGVFLCGVKERPDALVKRMFNSLKEEGVIDKEGNCDLKKHKILMQKVKERIESKLIANTKR
jgi:Leucine-rich repeat (LRR) protein